MATKGKYIYEWPRAMVTVDALVFCLADECSRVLLIRRGSEPFKGYWALPGGFVEMDEELEDAAARELAEETGVEGVGLEQMHTFGECGRDPRGRQISIAFFGVLSNEVDVRGGDDAAEARWFDIDNLPEKLGFDHRDVLRMGIERLKKDGWVSRS